MPANEVNVFTLPKNAVELVRDAPTVQTLQWLDQHGIEYVEHDASTALGIVTAEEHAITDYPFVSISAGSDSRPEVFGGYQPDQLEQLLVNPSQ